MKIGIDVDGVIIDFEERFRYRAELFNLLEKEKSDIVKVDKFWVEDRYNINEEQWQIFSDKYLVELSKESQLIPGAKEVLELLKKDGNELIIISARGKEYEEMQTVVEEKFEEAGLKFNKYYWKVDNKVKICQQEKIDIMIDDNPMTCEKLAKNGIKTLFFKSIYGKVKKNKYLDGVYNWADVYGHIAKREF